MSLSWCRSSVRCHKRTARSKQTSRCPYIRERADVCRKRKRRTPAIMAMTSSIATNFVQMCFMIRDPPSNFQIGSFLSPWYEYFNKFPGAMQGRRDAFSTFAGQKQNISLSIIFLCRKHRITSIFLRFLYIIVHNHRKSFCVSRGCWRHSGVRRPRVRRP